MEALKQFLSDIWGLLQSLRQTVGVTDILDILIVTYLIYRILSFMRKTNASSVIKGVVTILLVAWVANFFTLTMMTYLMRQLLDLGIVVLIVLFQPEIRKMFEQMGSSRLNLVFRRLKRFENIEALIRCVVSASESMAKNQTGAIIVFEREVGLNDYTATGTMIDANPTPELIQNIFYENSPLHDGALIIREGRLLAAACMLPLSNNLNMNRELGMRHRAGIGISERSDAVALIVSEQTGTISVAVDGMLKRHLEIEICQLLLKDALMDSGSKRAEKKAIKTKKNKGNA